MVMLMMLLVAREGGEGEPLCLMEDAVVAEDGTCYSRNSIQEHIDFCEKKGKPLTSPMTSETMEPRLV
jgi:hypothetical protein